MNSNCMSRMVVPSWLSTSLMTSRLAFTSCNSKSEAGSCSCDITWSGNFHLYHTLCICSANCPSGSACTLTMYRNSLCTSLVKG